MTVHTAPANLNGELLITELAAVGITVSSHALSLDGDELTILGDHEHAAVEAVVRAHRGGESPSVTNERLIRQQVTDHLDDLRTITGSSGALSNAQLSNAVRVLARGQIRLIRLTVGLLDGTK